MEKAWQGAQQTQSEEELSPPSPSNTALKALTGARGQEKEGGENPTGKEIKAPCLQMVPYMRDPHFHQKAHRNDHGGIENQLAITSFSRNRQQTL